MQMGDEIDDRCPACGTGAGGERYCTRCGFELGGPAAAELRVLLERVRTTDRELAAISARRQVAASDYERRRAALRSAVAPSGTVESPAAEAAWSGTRREVSPDRVRNTLLWLGTALLALSALTFTAVAWTRLDDGGRALLLAAVTIAATFLAVAAAHRLPATGEALSGLAIALAIIDCYALRRAGVGAGLSGVAWWSIGTAGVAGFAGALGSRTGPRTTRFAVATLLPVSAVLIVTTACSAAWSIAIGLAFVAVVLVLVEERFLSRVHDAMLCGLVRVEALLVWVAATIAAAVGIFDGAGTSPSAALGERILPALAVLALGAAPACRVVMARQASSPRLIAAMVGAASVVGAALVLLAAIFDASGMAIAAAVLGAVTIVMAGRMPEPWRGGAAATGAAVSVPGLLVAIGYLQIAMFAPLGWFQDPWNGSASATARDVFAGPETRSSLEVTMTSVVVLLLAAGAAVAAGTTGGGRRRIVARGPALVGAAFAGMAAVVLLPLAAGASVTVASVLTATACSITIVGFAVASAPDRDRTLFAVTLGALPAIAAIGWAAVTPGLTLTALAVFLVAATTASAIGRSEPLRTVHAAFAGAAAIGLAGLAVAAANAGTAPAGFAAATVSVVIAVAAAVRGNGTPRGRSLEWVGAVGFFVGALFAATSPAWLAGAFTIAVPAFAFAAIEPVRRIRYGTAAAVAALGATWAWLAAADVGVIEAYTLPAALAAAIVGEFASTRKPGRSFLTLGPAIVLAFGPTLTLAVQQDDVLRAVLVGVSAFALVLVGAQRRLQAPLVLGAIVLLVLGIDTLGPAAARLPRWIALAVPGAILLWVGATFERRREAARAAMERFTKFG